LFQDSELIWTPLHRTEKLESIPMELRVTEIVSVVVLSSKNETVWNSGTNTRFHSHPRSSQIMN
jgi:hypothetical protein